MSGSMTLGQARDRIFRLLALRDWTCRQVYDKLLAQGADSETAAAAVGEMAALGILNDYVFAVKHVTAAFSRKPRGPGLLLAELRRSGVPRDVAERVVCELLGPEKEQELAVLLATDLLNKGEQRPEKLLERLVRRGFSIGVATKVVEEEFDSYLDIML